MLIVTKVIGDEVYILDTEDNCIVESVSKGIYLQSKVLGIPVEDRYIEELKEFDTDVLRAGFFELGVDTLLNWTRDVQGNEHLPELEFKKMPIDKLFSVTSDAEKQIRVISNVDYAKLIESGVSKQFQDLFNYISDSKYTGDLYEDEELEDDLFSDEEDVELEHFGEDADFEDDSTFDYGDEDEFLDDEDTTNSIFVVSQLYNRLSEKELGLLQEYSKYHSKRVFGDSCGDLDLSTNSGSSYMDWKRKELSNIHGDENWVYEGYIDTGKYPGGYCEMGHSLRYIHFARGRKSGKVVKFGIKCIGDFFEVDSTVTNGLLKAQRENLADLLELSQIYSNKASLESAKKSFVVFNKLYKAELAKKQTSEDFEKLLELIDAFHSAGLVYPKSMTKLFKVYLFEVDTLKDVALSAKTRSRVLGDIFGVTGLQVDSYFKQISGIAGAYVKYDYSSLRYPTKSFLFSLSALLDLTFNTNLESIYKYNPVLGFNVRNEGGKSKQAIERYKNRQIASEMCYLYVEDAQKQISTLEDFFSTFNQALEANNLFNSLLVNWKKPYLNAYDVKFRNLSSVLECKTSCTKMLALVKSSRFTPTVDVANKAFEKYVEDFKANVSSLVSFRVGFYDICKSIVIDEEPAESKPAPFINLDFSMDNFDSTLEDIDYNIRLILESPLADKFKSMNSFPMDVLETIRSKRHVSEKQLAVMNKFVKSLENAVTRINTGVFDETSEDKEMNKIVSDCQRVIDVLDSGEYFREVVKVVPTHTLQKLKGILQSVCNRRSASEKQMYYVNIARNVLAEVDKSRS